VSSIETGNQAELVRTLAHPARAAIAVTSFEVVGTNEQAAGLAIERSGEQTRVSEASPRRHRRTADFAVGLGLTPLPPHSLDPRRMADRLGVATLEVLDFAFVLLGGR
jgi:hypothetical protein